MIKKKKKRDTSYSKTSKLIKKHGLEKIESLWKEHSMYDTAEILETTPWIIRYVAQKHGFKKSALTCPHLVKGVKAGKIQASSYKNLDWSEVDLSNNNNKNNGDKNE